MTDRKMKDKVFPPTFSKRYTTKLLTVQSVRNMQYLEMLRFVFCLCMKSQYQVHPNFSETVLC